MILTTIGYCDPASPERLQTREQTASPSMPAYPFSNDQGLAATFNQMSEFIEEHPHTKQDVALMVGSAGVFSFLPVLPEQVYIGDYCGKLLRWVDEEAKAISHSSNKEEYIDWLTDRALVTHDLVIAHSNELRSFGDKHFLSSDANFTSTKDRLKDTSIDLIHIDLTLPPSINELVGLLQERQHHIKVANFTNFHTYAAGRFGEGTIAQITHLLEITGSLPFNEEAYIFGTETISRPLNGLSYRDFAKTLIDLLIISKHRRLV